jgi:glycopeptide antibiotics resistance protein
VTTATGPAVVTLLGLAVGALVATLGPARPRRYRLAEAAMIAGTLPWLYLILRTGTRPRTIYWLPLSDLRDQFRIGLAFAVEQIGGNLLVFAAFGAAAPVRWRLRPPAVLLIAATASALLEVTQLALANGRVTSVDDVLVNAVGAGLAALVTRRWWRVRRRRSSTVDDSGTTLSPDAGTVRQR